jgi:hypothetical protein
LLRFNIVVITGCASSWNSTKCSDQVHEIGGIENYEMYEVHLDYEIIHGANSHTVDMMKRNKLLCPFQLCMFLQMKGY